MFCQLGAIDSVIYESISGLLLQGVNIARFFIFNTFVEKVIPFGLPHRLPISVANHGHSPPAGGESEAGRNFMFFV